MHWRFAAVHLLGEWRTLTKLLCLTEKHSDFAHLIVVIGFFFSIFPYQLFVPYSLLQRHVILKKLTSSFAMDTFLLIFATALIPTQSVYSNTTGQLARLCPPLDDAGGRVYAFDLARSRCPRFTQHVTDIRELPGLSRFLLPSLFTDPQQAASSSPGPRSHSIVGH